jgi:zinc transporter ZupT
MTPLVWFSLLAGTAPLIAATIPFYLFKNGINPRTFQLLLGVSAGLLFAIATLELIPEAFEMVELSAQPQQVQIQSRDSRHLLFSHKLLATDDSPNYATVETLDEVGEHEHEEGKGRIPMLGLGAGFVFLIILEQLMSGNGGHSHSHSHVANKHDDEEEVSSFFLYLHKAVNILVSSS